MATAGTASGIVECRWVSVSRGSTHVLDQSDTNQSWSSSTSSLCRPKDHRRRTL